MISNLELALIAAKLFTDPMRHDLRPGRKLDQLSEIRVEWFEQRMLNDIYNILEESELRSCSGNKFGQGNCNIVCLPFYYDSIIKAAASYAELPYDDLWNYIPNLHIRIKNRAVYQVRSSGLDVWLDGVPAVKSDVMSALNNDIRDWVPLPGHVAITVSIPKVEDLKPNQKFSLKKNGQVYIVDRLRLIHDGQAVEVLAGTRQKGVRLHLSADRGIYLR